MVILKLRSSKKNEINKFLSKFYNTNLDISENLTWQKVYTNPIEISDLIGVFIDNIDMYNIKMWICLDKYIYINVSDSNGNDIIKYLFERFPY